MMKVYSQPTCHYCKKIKDVLARANHFKDNPMKPLHLEDRIEQVHNAVKNLTLLLTQMQQTIQRISTQVAGTPPQQPPIPQQAPPTPQQQPVE